ncbi:MAG: S49 family peptidase [Chloroflexi bacterium]|nr:S49 family peptidase [Chloroflexota bacterium]
MSRIARFFLSWYVAIPALAVVGIVLGYLAFFNLFPGKPQIGIITIPFVVINEDSAFVIGSYLEYARRQPRIKGVVLKLSSPGGGASSSEELYLESRKLRAEKPLVMVMGGLVASGGYMMAMGANYTYVKSSSLVGNVGVISFAGPVIPSVPPENLVVTGPSKLSGSTRREWIGMVDLLKQSFAQMVITERGDRLRISEEQLLEGRLYAGVEAVQLGLADAIGNDSDAIERVADMAGISNYELVDINTEVDRLFIQKIRRIFAVSSDAEPPADLSGVLALMSLAQAQGDPAGGLSRLGYAAGLSGSSELGNLLRSGVLQQTQEDPLPGFPLEISRPNIYYIYAGPYP